MKKRFLTYSAVLLALASCIKNDLPYPVVVPSITSMQVSGALSVDIDSDARTVSIVLDETTDLSNVHIVSVDYDESITTSDPELQAVHDLSSPLKVTLKTYQEYDWTITATRPVERYFTVRGQIGASVIDDVNRRVVASVASTVDISSIEVLSLKLGPRDITTIMPEMSQMHDFTDGLTAEVSYYGKTEEWHLYVEQTESVVDMTSVDAWTRCAWLSAAGLSDRQNGFRYRRKGVSEWTEAQPVKSDGGTFSVCLDGLEPLTDYECIAYSGSDETALWEFTTGAEEQLPNSGFNTFSHAESGVYYSWFDPASAFDILQTKWWDSGNIGSTTVGSSYSIAVPDTGDKKEGAASAALISRNVVIKFAAGNTFSGEFAGLVGTQGGIINFGRPWTLRPRSLRIWVKYECGAIDVIDSYPADNPVKIGDPDTAQLWAALGDWDYKKFGGTSQCPVQVNTTEKSTFFKPGDPAVIAYGSVELSQSTDGWVEIEIPLDYRSVSRRPTHIIVSFASSKLGDYFTGSSSSKLWVDDVRLIY